LNFRLRIWLITLHSSHSSNYSPSNLIRLDRLKQRFEVTFAKTLVPLALNDFEENGADDILRKDLKQHSLTLGGIAIDQNAPLL
jgi:hypothetical protein